VSLSKSHGLLLLPMFSSGDAGYFQRLKVFDLSGKGSDHAHGNFMVAHLNEWSLSVNFAG